VTLKAWHAIWCKAYVRVDNSFREVKLLEIFFSKFFLNDRHLIQVILYFLEFCGNSYEFLKLKCSGY